MPSVYSVRVLKFSTKQRQLAVWGVKCAALLNCGQPYAIVTSRQRLFTLWKPGLAG